MLMSKNVNVLFQVLFPSPLIPLSLVCIHSLLVHFVACLTNYLCLHSVLFSTIAFHCPSALSHFSALLHVSLYLSFGRPTGSVPSANSPYNKDFTGRSSSIRDTWPSHRSRLLTNNISISYHPHMLLRELLRC